MRQDSTSGLAVRGVQGLVCVPEEAPGTKRLPEHPAFYGAREGNWPWEMPAAQPQGPWAWEVLSPWVVLWGAAAGSSLFATRRGSPCPSPPVVQTGQGHLGHGTPHSLGDAWVDMYGTRRVGGIKRKSEVITDRHADGSC